LQYAVRFVDQLELKLCLLPKSPIVSKAIRMPHLHQIPICFFDLGGSCARSQRQNVERFDGQQSGPSELIDLGVFKGEASHPAAPQSEGLSNAS
jgi:hypothetical protein